MMAWLRATRKNFTPSRGLRHLPEPCTRRPPVAKADGGGFLCPARAMLRRTSCTVRLALSRKYQTLSTGGPTIKPCLSPFSKADEATVDGLGGPGPAATARRRGPHDNAVHPNEFGLRPSPSVACLS